MKTSKIIYILLIVVILIWATLDIFPYLIYRAYINDQDSFPLWLHFFVLIAGIIGVQIVRYFNKTHSTEVDAAVKTLYAPKNKYGWYGLVFFFIWILSYLTYVFWEMYH